MYDNEIKKYSAQYNINPLVIKALIEKESGFDTWASRFESHWRWFVSVKKFARKNKISFDTEKTLQSTSFGLCQVMGGVARELGFEGQLTKLCIPSIGIELGCKKLRQCLDRWGSLDRALAAYNAGSPESSVGKKYAESIFKIMERTTYG